MKVQRQHMLPDTASIGTGSWAPEVGQVETSKCLQKECPVFTRRFCCLIDEIQPIVGDGSSQVDDHEKWYTEHCAERQYSENNGYEMEWFLVATKVAVEML